MYLKVHHDHHVTNMLEISQQLESTAIQLQEHLRFNHSSLRNAVEHLLVEVEQAQQYLYNEGPTIVVKVSNIDLLDYIIFLCSVLFVLSSMPKLKY